MQKLAAYSLILALAAALPVQAEDDIQTRIFNSYLEQANAGDSNSQFIVASRYESGKGTTRDLDKAWQWYEKAAAKGHPLAQRKLDERQATQSPRAHSDPMAEKLAAAAASARNTRPAPKPAARPAANGTTRAAPVAAAPKPESVMATKAAEPAPGLSVNALQTVLGGKWSRQKKPAEYLQSAQTACLKTNDTEVVCFSEEFTRNVGGNGLSYTVKSTLSGLDSRDGRFSLHYVYNVVDVNGSPFPKTTSSLNDAGDLVARKGWQEPGIKLECRLADERSLSCARGDRKGTFQYARD